MQRELSNQLFGLGGSPMSQKDVAVRPAVDRLDAAADSEGDALPPEGASLTPTGRGRVGQSLPPGPRRGTSGTVAPPDSPVGHVAPRRAPAARPHESDGVALASPVHHPGRPNHQLELTGRAPAPAGEQRHQRARQLNSAVRPWRIAIVAKRRVAVRLAVDPDD